MGPVGKVMATKPGPSAVGKPHIQNKSSTPLQRKIRLVHRFLVFGVAVWYVVISLMATEAVLTILRGKLRYESGLLRLTSPLIAGYAGLSTIRKSPLVVDVLSDSTEPKTSGTLFLESESSSSFTQCKAVVEGDAVNIYKDDYLRSLFIDLQNKITYNISLLGEIELILPVVDCGFQLIKGGGGAIARVNYLVRYKDDPQRVLLLPTSFSIQDYYIAEQYERGSALLVAFSVIENLIEPGPVKHHFAIAIDYPFEFIPDFEVCTFFEHTDDGFWSLETIPSNPFLTPSKPLLTARQLGFYIDKETSQVNMINFYWKPANNPTAALSQWNWYGDSVIRDNWVWAHIIHLFFSIDVIFQLILLLFLVYRSIIQRHFWIGDAFASISNALLYRGIYVVISNHVNGYWTLAEFCLALANSLGGQSVVKYNPKMAHADMLTIYLNIVSVLSYLLKERVDPIFALVCFEIGFHSRQGLAKVFPALRKMLVNYSNTESAYGRVQVDEFLAKLSPMRFWTVHPIHQGVMPLIVVTFLVIYSTLVIVVLYVFLRKLYYWLSMRFQVGQGIPGHRSPDSLQSDSESRELMQFETATGSVLKNRFGILSTYKNYTFKNGCRFASGDAIYCNGFVVANDKFVIATEDLMSLIIMKLTRARFTNIYVYTIKGDTGVNQTARLVYPSTISWHDLSKVSVSPLP